MSRAAAGAAILLVLSLLAGATSAQKAPGSPESFPSASQPGRPDNVPAPGSLPDSRSFEAARPVSPTAATTVDPSSPSGSPSSTGLQLPLGIIAPELLQPLPIGVVAEQAVKVSAPETLTSSTLALDISTASFYELVDWLRSLGLSDSGGKAELRSRLYDFYKVKAPPDAKAAGRTVTIESANQAIYSDGTKAPARDGETARSGGLIELSGDVRLTVKDAASADSYTISAREVVYDRDRNSVFASGSVVYTRTGQGRLEEFRGSTLSADLSDWSGLFLDGVWRRDKAGTGAGTGTGTGTGTAERGLIFKATTLDKSSGEYFSLIDATVSPSDKESPNFSIRAQRLWFLGGNDWAALSALLYLGEVPLLWIPFFYYPSEEIVFHPVFGYRDREGRFLQTTTYFIGQKPVSKTGSTILKLAPETGPTEPRGLFLKRIVTSASTDPAKASQTGKGSSDYAKLFVDVYDGLGGFVGFDASLAAVGPFARNTLISGIALSRSLFSNPYSLSYTPFSAAGNWESLWNQSRLLGIPLNLRFGFSLASNVGLGTFNSSFELPLYSDPFFESDFRNRSEDMDWLQFSKPATTTATTTISKRTSFTQRFTLSGSYRSDILSPWLSSASLSRLASSLTWRSKTDSILALAQRNTTINSVDPAREFFMPDILRPFDVAVDLSGTVFEYPRSSGSGATAKKDETGTKPLPLKAPWDVSATAKSPDPAPPGIPDFPAPLPAPDPPYPASSLPFSVKVSWAAQPGLILERRFLSDAWNGASALTLVPDYKIGGVWPIDFASLYDLASWRTGASVNSSFTFLGNILTAAAGLTWSDQDQARTITSNPYFDPTRKALQLSDLQYAQRRLLGTFRFGAQPLQGNEFFGASNVSWNLSSILYSRLFSANLYQETFPAWNPSSISSHTVGLTAALRTGTRSQSFSLTASLPPTTESWSANLGLDGGMWGYSLGFSAQERVSRTNWGDPYTWSPFSATFRVATPFGLNASDTAVHDFSKGYPVSNSASLTWDWASISYQAQRAKASIPVTGSGWSTSTVEEFLPTSLSLSLNPKYQAPATDPFRPAANLNFSYSQSLLRFTDSTLTLGLSASVSVGSGFTFTLSTQSQNRNAWKYWPGLLKYAPDYTTPANTALNPFVDVVDSLSFWDAGARTRGNFKLKSLALRVSQDLEDWTVNFDASATPKLDTVIKNYYIDPSLSLTIAWKDIPEIKSALTYLDKKFSW